MQVESAVHFYSYRVFVGVLDTSGDFTSYSLCVEGREERVVDETPSDACIEDRNLPRHDIFCNAQVGVDLVVTFGHKEDSFLLLKTNFPTKGPAEFTLGVVGAVEAVRTVPCYNCNILYSDVRRPPKYFKRRVASCWRSTFAL